MGRLGMDQICGLIDSVILFGTVHIFVIRGLIYRLSLEVQTSGLVSHLVLIVVTVLFGICLAQSLDSWTSGRFRGNGMCASWAHTTSLLL